MIIVVVTIEFLKKATRLWAIDKKVKKYLNLVAKKIKQIKKIVNERKDKNTVIET